MNGEILYADIFNRNGISAFMPLYEHRRCLKDLTIDKLKERFDRLLDNLSVFDWGGNYHFLVNNDEIGTKFIHAQLECQLRGINFDNIINKKMEYYNSKLLNFDIDKIKIINNKIGNKNVIIKYLPNEYIDFWKKGGIHFSLSSNYNDLSIPVYKRDEENSIAYDNVSGLSIMGEDSGPVVRVFKLQSTVRPYYLTCFSAVFNPKLFVLFELDSCIIIYNVPEYISTVKEYLIYKYNNSHVFYEPIKYVDEVCNIELENRIEFTKRYIFQYEKEQRLILYFDDENENKNNSKEYMIDGINIECDSLTFKG